MLNASNCSAVDLSTPMFDHAKNECLLDSYSIKFTPKWTHLLVYDASVFRNYTRHHLDITQEHMIIMPRHMDETLLWIKVPSKYTDVPEKLLRHIRNALVTSADFVVFFDDWPNGNVKYLKDRYYGVSNPTDEKLKAELIKSSNEGFSRQFDMWMDNLY